MLLFTETISPFILDRKKKTCNLRCWGRPLNNKAWPGSSVAKYKSEAQARHACEIRPGCTGISHKFRGNQISKTTIKKSSTAFRMCQLLSREVIMIQAPSKLPLHPCRWRHRRRCHRNLLSLERHKYTSENIRPLAVVAFGPLSW